MSSDLGRPQNSKHVSSSFPAIIDELDSVEVRLNDGPRSRNWTLVLHGVCADNASLEAHSAHPAHLECVAVIKPLIAARACVDYTD